jgi:ketosteroid isomerase-like protein
VLQREFLCNGFRDGQEEAEALSAARAARNTGRAVSQQNVDALRLGFEAVNGGDLEGLLALVDPNFEAEIPPELSAEPDTYRGHEGLRRYFRAFDDAMEEVRFVPERFWDAGDSVVAIVRLTARGRETRIPVEQRVAQVWTFRDGKAVRVRPYATTSEALAAVGLGE